MDQSKSSALIIFVIGNYFFTFLIIGLIAAGISLLNEPRPVRIRDRQPQLDLATP
jgi:hypothetical protein